MSGCAESAALERAARALSTCFEVARARGYRPGDPAMQELERAELAFQLARRRWRARLEDAAAPAADGHDDVVVDLREPHRPEPPADSPTRRQPDRR